MSTIITGPDTKGLLSEAKFRERLHELPSSTELATKVFGSDAPLSQGQLAEESLLLGRTIRCALNHLEESDLVGSRYSSKNMQKQVYSLNT